MEPLIFFSWFFLAVGIPLSLTIISFKELYIEHARTVGVLAKLIFAGLIYSIITAPLFWMMFLMIFAGAHTEPVGNALSIEGRIFYAGLVLVYALVGWLLCSLVNGSLIRPWSILSFDSSKPISIIERS